MTTPSHYLREQLKKVLTKNKYFLYHWTSSNAALNIINDGFIYSKAMLFGLHYHNNPQLLNNIKPHDARTEAINGFVDYVFLGNTNWSDYSGNSAYGSICFVINPEILLPNREFFVFPFNTGRYFSAKPEHEKTSDIGTLLKALEQDHARFEVLVRRRIKINKKNINKILCVPTEEKAIKDFITRKSLDIPIERIDGLNTMQKDSITFVDPLDKNRRETCLNGDQYVRKDDLIYIKTEFSNCILTLKINESNQLIDVETNEIVGQLSPAKCLFAR
ncbi:MAG: hypothetical protein KIT56_09200 [Gammaproteobacteria bacterium]|nr:hypothetical protein [Gammaproteobacteria bacterium]MCW5584030.1 hypothetical protein [Gammaproteobacteria bacterium]